MDRTEELIRSAQIFGLPSTTASRPSSLPLSSSELTPYTKIALRAATVLDSNEELVSKMTTLSERKEFSNDPTAAMTELTTHFQKQSSSIQLDLTQLKQHTDGATLSTHRQQQQHYKIVLEHLQKRLAGQVAKFKTALKAHGENVKARTERVTSKYGHGSEQLRAGAASLAASSSSYAMFAMESDSDIPNRINSGPPGAFRSRLSGPSTTPPSSADGSIGSMNPELRRRFVDHGPNLDRTPTDRSRSMPAGVGIGSNNLGSSSSAGTVSSGGLVQNLLQHKSTEQADARLSSAKKVEASIAQMGQLFSSLATLVMEQSESIARIEDDVEEGLQNVTEGHSSILKVSEITKGNRAMILKVFALLILFIFLFLVWT